MLKPDFLLGRLQSQQAAMLATFRAMPTEALSRAPGLAEWSPLQVLSHVTKVEESVVGGVRSKLGKPFQATTLTEAVRGVGLCVWSLTPAKVKMPDAAVRFTSPEPDADLDELAARWRTARAAFGDLDYEAIAAKAVVFRNPFSGWLTMTGTLRFLIAHTFHHRHQLRRIARAAV